MANKEDNLKPFTSDQNREQAAINGSKGGVASGIARRRKSICNKLLNNLITKEEAKKELEANGLEDELTELAYSMYDLLRTSRDKKNEKTSDRLKALEMLMNYADVESQENSDTPIININIVDNGVTPEEKALYNDYENN